MLTAEQIQEIVSGRKTPQTQPVADVRNILRRAPAEPRDTSLTGVAGASPIAQGRSLRQSMDVPLTQDPRSPVGDLAVSADPRLPAPTVDGATQRFAEPTPMVPFVAGPGQKDRVPAADTRTAADIARDAKVSAAAQRGGEMRSSLASNPFIQALLPQTSVNDLRNLGVGAIEKAADAGSAAAAVVGAPRASVYLDEKSDQAAKLREGYRAESLAARDAGGGEPAPAAEPLSGSRSTKAGRAEAAAFFNQKPPAAAAAAGQDDMVKQIMGMTNMQLASAMGMLPDAPAVKDVKEQAGQMLMNTGQRQLQEAYASGDQEQIDAATQDLMSTLELIWGADALKTAIAASLNG